MSYQLDINYITHPKQPELHPEFLANYIIGEELGSGGYGFVISAIERHTGIERAVKFIFKHKIPAHHWVNDKDLGAIPMEVYVLRNVQHPSIVQFINYYQDARFCYLVMELHGTQWTSTDAPVRSPALSETSSSSCSSGYSSATMKRRTSCDLFECIERHRYFQEPLAKHIFKQIVSCIAHLDMIGVCHRDIKDENIVIDNQFQVKLIDFGSAVLLPRHFGDHQTHYLYTQFFGTVSFASPEILLGRPYRAEPAEIWSLGVLLYTILFGQVPFHDSNMAIAGQFAQPNLQVSPACFHLISCMLQQAPESRPTIHQVLKHPWFLE